MSEACAACGMALKGPAYHPHLACLAFKQTRDGATVEANLRAVVEYGMMAARGGATVEEAMANISWTARATPTKASTQRKTKPRRKR